MKQGKLDIVLGMQYGDEGKGASAVMLHRENNYHFSVRVGGSQAEHRFRDKDIKYRCRVLPAACCWDAKCRAYLGAGHIIRPDILKQEIDRYRHGDWTDVRIDGNAAVVDIIERQQSQTEGLHNKRGGYGMGISTTLCKKVRRDPDAKILVRQNDDIDDRSMTSVKEEIWRELNAGHNGLVEGSQGALLSLDHGDYPHVTSYNVNVGAIMGSIGLSPRFIGTIYGVVRAFPMRVAGDSGSFIGMETSFDEIEKHMNIKISDYRKYQTNEDDTPNAPERIAHWDVRGLISGLLQNAPDKIILTHTDWLKPWRRDEIIEEIQRVGQFYLGRPLPVAYIRHGDDLNDYRRSQQKTL